LLAHVLDHIEVVFTEQGGHVRRAGKLGQGSPCSAADGMTASTYACPAASRSSVGSIWSTTISLPAAKPLIAQMHITVK
jgi:hypothetical protein